MKTLLTFLTVACVAGFGLTGCACKQGTQKTCLMTKKACDGKTVCCAAPSGKCPMKKHSPSASQ